MREVDKEYESEKDENGCTYKCHIVSPKHEEFIWDKERYHNKHEPEQDLGTPPPKNNEKY